MKQASKSIFFLIILSVLSFGKTAAQTYSLNKNVYDHRQYIPRFGDVYDPMLMGAYSAVLPGMGQMICGETGRGLAFMVPGVIAYGAITVGTVRSFQESHRDFWKKSNSDFKNSSIKDDANIGLPLIIGGLVGAVIINTWSFIDAVKVAKVTNMYLRDVRDGFVPVSLKIDPFVETNTYLGQWNTCAGISLKVTF